MVIIAAATADYDLQDATPEMFEHKFVFGNYRTLFRPFHLLRVVHLSHASHPHHRFIHYFLNVNYDVTALTHAEFTHAFIHRHRDIETHPLCEKLNCF